MGKGINGLVLCCMKEAKRREQGKNAKNGTNDTNGTKGGGLNNILILILGPFSLLSSQILCVLCSPLLSIMASIMALCNCCITTSKHEHISHGLWLPNPSTTSVGFTRITTMRASLLPSSSGSGGAGRIIRGTGAPSGPSPLRELYQPFRPPPEANPSADNISIEEQLQILRDRRGLWFQYAVHVPTLIRAGFTPPMIDEATGITGVEQNKIVVASQVRSSLESSGLDPSLLAEFDGPAGSTQLYELRILSARQRRSAAEFALSRRMSTKEYRDLARAMKDYERRRREEGWESFTFTPGDCLAYSCYRLSKELKSDGEQREAVLKKGLEYAETEKAMEKLKAALLNKAGQAVGEEGDEEEEKVGVETVRLSADAMASSYESLVLVPVAEMFVEEVEAAPAVVSAISSKKKAAATATATAKGLFPIHEARSAWKSWISLPAWSPLAAASHPVALLLPNSSVLPWKLKDGGSRKDLEEALVLIVDKESRKRSEEEEKAVYAVEGENGKVNLEMAAEEGLQRVLGKAVLLLRPEREEKQEFGIEDIEWD